MKIWVIRILSLLLTLTMMAVIFSFSANTGEESGKQSGEITKDILESVGITEDTKPHEEYEKIYHTSDLLLRKAAHFSEYFLLALFFSVFMQSVTEKKKVALSVACGGSIVYAALDEIHQMFVAGRGPAVTDVLIDSGGALAGILLSFFVGKWLLRVKQRT